MFELMTRVLCESQVPWRDIDGVYLFGQTSDNEDSVLNMAVEIHTLLRKRIFLCDGETGHGYPGFPMWQKKLLARGVGEDSIFPIRTPYEKNINTHSEAESLVGFAKSNDWEKAVVVAPPFHQLRAFITAVSVAVREYPELQIWSCVGTPLDWGTRVRHSQGTTVGTRIELLAGELARIHKYYEKGDLISAGDVLSYLNRRDAQKEKNDGK